MACNVDEMACDYTSDIAGFRAMFFVQILERGHG